MNFRTKNIVFVGIFAALTAVGAYIRIPIPFVPFTLQFLFCALAGILLGSKLGALSQILYVVVGLMGVPVFTEGGGLGYILKPTFGYLIGFIVGAYVIGKLVENIYAKKQHLSLGKTSMIILSGLFFVYLFGVIYLYLIYNLYLGIGKSFYWALFYGCIVCSAGDIVLSIITAFLSVRIVNIMNKSGMTLV